MNTIATSIGALARARKEKFDADLIELLCTGKVSPSTCVPPDKRDFVNLERNKNGSINIHYISPSSGPAGYSYSLRNLDATKLIEWLQGKEKWMKDIHDPATKAPRSAADLAKEKEAKSPSKARRREAFNPFC